MATVEFNYDISCPFAYIASTRIQTLGDRTSTPISYRPVLLGALYRATSAPQGAAGSASDVFNSTKKAVTAASMKRTLKRYQIAYNPPAAHPRKSVDALRLLYCVPDGPERQKLSELFFQAYWVNNIDVTSKQELLRIAKKSGIASARNLTLKSFDDPTARKNLEENTAKAIERGTFGVPGFWIPDVKWIDVFGEQRKGRYFWGQDRMHFVEATLLSSRLSIAGSETSSTPATSKTWSQTPNLLSLMPHCIPASPRVPSLPYPTRLEFYFDFSSPWAYLGYTQLARLQATYPTLQIVLKPFLLGILFREIGAPNLPMAAVSATKAAWSRQDHGDWVNWWNAVNAQSGNKFGKEIDFTWAEKFPIRTPTVLRVGIVDESTVPLLYSACWEKNADVSDEAVLAEVLTKGGHDGPGLIKKANAQEVKNKLRAATAEAKELGICGVPTYRVLRQSKAGTWDSVGRLVWGQDETNVVEDLIMGWTPESSNELAEPRKGENSITSAKL